MLDSVTHGGRIFSMMPADDLLAAGVPQNIIDAALGLQRARDVKAECKRRIYARASQETQANMTAAAAVIVGKPAGERSEDEQQVLAAFAIAMEWVKAMRATVATLAADAQADFRNDANWPPLPPEAAELAAVY